MFKELWRLALMLAPLAVSAGEAPVTLYRDISLFDGTGGAVVAHRSILVKGERVDQVGGADLMAPEGARIVDGQGAYLIPGLIDSHVHLATVPNRAEAEAIMRRDLYGGVTAVRDMAGDARFLAELSRETLLGEVPGPDIAYAALMAGPDFFVDPRTHAASKGLTAGAVPWLQAVDGKTDLKIAVAEARGTGASAIKIYADLPGSTVKAIVAEAHRQHFPVWAHSMVFPATPEEGIDAGIDVISHACMLAYQAMKVKPTRYHDRAAVQPELIDREHDPMLAKLFQAMTAKGVMLDATLRVYREGEKRLEKDPHRSGSYCPLELAASITAQAHRAGVSVSAGTDGVAPAAEPWPEVFDEIALLAANAGFTPAEALQAATVESARAMGREADLGTVQPGKLADFVLLGEDPTKDLAALHSVRLVVKRGTAYPREGFKPLTEEELRD
jgi:imidazolonepropionase-like amidohydrolase